jgi:hypothetical protein
MPPEDERPPGHDDELPRQGFWMAVPKRSLFRLLLLLAMLAGILYLRHQTTSIAGCMSNAFSVPPGESSGARLKAKVVLPSAPAERAP